MANIIRPSQGLRHTYFQRRRCDSSVLSGWSWNPQAS
jgi:hypothetical protein